VLCINESLFSRKVVLIGIDPRRHPDDDREPADPVLREAPLNALLRRLPRSAVFAERL
jgi:hypothetical protein